MNRINPFDLSFNQGAGKAGSVNSPEKIQQNPEQKEAQASQGVGALQNTDENTMVDASSMVDDTESFDMSGFEGENEDQNINSTDKANESEQGKDSGNNDKQDKEELMAQIEEMASNFFDKKNPQE